jgi:hypothetical protein
MCQPVAVPGGRTSALGLMLWYTPMLTESQRTANLRLVW